MSKRRRVLCPTPSKRGYVDQTDATGGAVYALHSMRRAGQQTTRLFIYPCPCRKWHVSGNQGSSSVRIDLDTEHPRAGEYDLEGKITDREPFRGRGSWRRP